VSKFPSPFLKKILTIHSCRGQADGDVVSALLGLLGIAVDPITALVGANCTPVNIFGIGTGGMCTSQPICCQNNTFVSVLRRFSVYSLISYYLNKLFSPDSLSSVAPPLLLVSKRVGVRSMFLEMFL